MTDKADETDVVKIPLRNKYKEIISYTIVDKDVYETITFSCCLDKDGYALGKVNGRPIRLHRFIMNAKKGDPIIDHINNDKLDNRKVNLRFVNHSQNCQNKAKLKGTSSKYIGVYKKGNKWVVKIRTKEKRLEKTFDKEEHAAYWYDIEALKYYSSDNYTPKINNVEKPIDYEHKEMNKKISYGTRKTRSGNYEVKIQHNNKSIYLGTYKTEEEAHNVYKNKKEELKANKIIVSEIRRNKDNIAIILTSKNEEILVDDDKYYNLVEHKWSVTLDGYAQATINKKRVNMHRYLLDAKKGDPIVDHINHNRLDNRIKNLRTVDDSLNSHNVTKRKNTSSNTLVYTK